ncbi:MAG: hypothetical protein KW788_04215 [Candidatus Doudnabacteria bacterium]|nr:hypothetical protein [Candidatus Doudnabacteria bacterium]
MDRKRDKARNKDDTIVAIVQRIYPEAKHGPYFMATSDEFRLGSVTCSLNPEVWKESRWPEEGSKVVLCDLDEKREGWRANSGRFRRITDIE